MLSRVREAWSLLAPHLEARLRPVLRPFDPLRARAAALPARTRILAGVSGLLLLIALLVFAWSGPGDPAPTDEYVYLRCSACRATPQITHREFERRWQAREFARNGAGPLCFKCPDCGQFAAVSAPPGQPAADGAPADPPAAPIPAALAPAARP